MKKTRAIMTQTFGKVDRTFLESSGTSNDGIFKTLSQSCVLTTDEKEAQQSSQSPSIMHSSSSTNVKNSTSTSKRSLSAANISHSKDSNTSANRAKKRKSKDEKSDEKSQVGHELVADKRKKKKKKKRQNGNSDYCCDIGIRDPNSGLPLIRNWKSSKNSILAQNYRSDFPKFNFRLCSYNILCQETMQTTPYLYTSCPNEWMQWDFRWQCIATELGTINADVVCLQEVTDSLYESHVRPFFIGNGFDGVFKKRTGLKPDGCATFWRKSKFSVDKVDSVEYQIPNTFMDRDNVGLIVRLTPLNSRNSKQRMVIANTHLLFNPGRGDIKLGQLALLLARIKQVTLINQQSKQRLPTLICGDFNCLPSSPLYNFITRGEINYHGMQRGDVTGQYKKGGPKICSPLLPPAMGVNENCELVQKNMITNSYNKSTIVTNIKFDPPLFQASYNASTRGYLKHDFRLKSVYDHQTDRGTREISSYHTREADTLDYIFYSASISDGRTLRNNVLNNYSKNVQQPNVDDLVCTGRYALPDKHQLMSTTGYLPSRTSGSDHLPLAADFELSVR
uniref:Endonuclease/exonuclease/phosphatase domain-containing protein n=1 Tax=Romanomermis culicivorax TaxID=13658 RepID=A0A915I0Y6_ROMCU